MWYLGENSQGEWNIESNPFITRFKIKQLLKIE